MSDIPKAVGPDWWRYKAWESGMSIQGNRVWSSQSIVLTLQMTIVHNGDMIKDYRGSYDSNMVIAKQAQQSGIALQILSQDKTIFRPLDGPYAQHPSGFMIRCRNTPELKTDMLFLRGSSSSEDDRTTFAAIGPIYGISNALITILETLEILTYASACREPSWTMRIFKPGIVTIYRKGGEV